MDSVFLLSSEMGNILKIYEDKVVICRKNATHGHMEESIIYYKDMTAVTCKQTDDNYGYIEFAYPGASNLNKGLLMGILNENRYCFGVKGFMTKKKKAVAEALNMEMLKVKDYVNSRINECRQSETTNAAIISVADEIAKFNQLCKDGIISREEFEAKKKQLLNT